MLIMAHIDDTALQGVFNFQINISILGISTASLIPHLTKTPKW
jgi:hypothetical protein